MGSGSHHQGAMGPGRGKGYVRLVDPHIPEPGTQGVLNRNLPNGHQDGRRERDSRVFRELQGSVQR